MSFNYGREEKKWRLWKEAEEKQLRSLGVSEDTIEQLHTHDWAVFNSDRRYYRRLQDAGTYLEEFAEETAQPEVKSVEDFLDNIENQQLYQILIMVDRLKATFTAEGRKSRAVVKLEEIEQISSLHRKENEDNGMFLKNPLVFTFLHRSLRAQP